MAKSPRQTASASWGRPSLRAGRAYVYALRGDGVGVCRIDLGREGALGVGVGGAGLAAS